MSIKAEKMHQYTELGSFIKAKVIAKITQNMLNAPFGMNITGFLMSEGIFYRLTKATLQFN